MAVFGLIATIAGLVPRAQSRTPGRGEIPGGARDPAWSPDGRRIALTLYDRLYLATLDGRSPGPLVTWDGSLIAERDPSWSPDGSRLAFAADTGSGFDVYVVRVEGGRPIRLTALPGDERWPSWTRDGRVVFAMHDAAQWDLAIIEADSIIKGVPNDPQRLTSTSDDEREPVVSPDGSRLAFVSNRGSEDGDLDAWVSPLLGTGFTQPSDGQSPAVTPAAQRVGRTRGDEHHPSWSPDGERLVVSSISEGVGSLWVVAVPATAEPGGLPARARPAAPPVLVSRQAGMPAWSPDGRTLAVTALPADEPTYNGNPQRNDRESPPLFARGGAFRWRTLPAPRKPDEDTRSIQVEAPIESTQWLRLFDRVWGTLERLYYRSGPSADAWRTAGDRYRMRAGKAASETAFEDVVDEMILAQPPIKSPASSRGAVVVSGHRLATEAGIAALERGGNVVDAAVAVSFALGVVEPDASGIGGDGMALVFLRGMSEPVVVDFKDQAPIHATLDNPRIMREGRLVADGAAAANIPGVVAGMEHLFKSYGSRKVAWADLIGPAIAAVEQGFELDEALPTTIREGRGFFEKHAAAGRIYLPNGRVPRPGEQFVNPDYGRTLRAIAAGGAEVFYRGSVARDIAEDMRRNGGIIGLEDLAQYRALERRPVSGRYRGHVVYTAPPPVSSGAGLIETLQILSNYSPGPRALPATDPDYFHYLAESWKARDPIRRIADPALWPVDLENHLEPAHAESRFRRISPTSALRFELDPDEIRDQGRDAAGDRIGRGTTAFVVADATGDIIAVTQTLSTWGGTFYVSEGLGFLYNNHLRGNRTRPRSYAQLMPLMRSSSTSVPTLVFRQEGGTAVPWLGLAAAGNAWIAASVYSVLTSLIDAQLTVQAAIEAPRFLVTRDPADPLGTGAAIQIEDRFPRRTLEALEARGHRFIKIGRKGEVRYGYAAAALVDSRAGRVEGGAEPRRSHVALGWEPPTAPSSPVRDAHADAESCARRARPCNRGTDAGREGWGSR